MRLVSTLIMKYVWYRVSTNIFQKLKQGARRGRQRASVRNGCDASRSAMPSPVCTGLRSLGLSAVRRGSGRPFGANRAARRTFVSSSQRRGAAPERVAGRRASVSHGHRHTLSELPEVLGHFLRQPRRDHVKAFRIGPACARLQE